MLQQILRDLYVDPEIISGLPDEQKQLLFCKMREEQIRRWHEKELELENIQEFKKLKNGKQVKFKLGSDGNEWVWVMGEHKDDKTIEQILEEQIEIQAEQETNVEREAKEMEIHNKMEVETKRLLDEELRKKQIEEISNNIQEARRIFERLEIETRRLMTEKEEEEKRKQQAYFERLKEKRKHELLEKLKEQQRKSLKENDDINERNRAWAAAEEKAKKAELIQREVAKKVRTDYRNSMQLNVCFDTSPSPSSSFYSSASNSFLHAPPLTSSILRSSTDLDQNGERSKSKEKTVQIEFVRSTTKPNTIDKPLNINESTNTSGLLSSNTVPSKRDDVKQWFRELEIPYGSFLSSNGHIACWFHGIITRIQAEQMLKSQRIGTYLIRVNEKIFGYALSYRASDHCRHLLIEVLSTENGGNSGDDHYYRFLGSKNEKFQSLNELIEKYSTNPIRPNSNDMLIYPLGQINGQQPDYFDLFDNKTPSDDLYIFLDTTTSLNRSKPYNEIDTHL
ncbi:unnamed protein product [Didymodactylos carnosus]|uniref:SH2 domain-containing protein n=1 Tax=Didymodactylos carnosus TaxID=1234261 RepID=A0A813PHP9_9BILA|nr:unnamed protein product [Didymodactylos carnosus]CAF1104112.1 unnamed protein product [Didymodactylos carnosus]CAF3530191.1 unnamed protein product [Didymodactylos carnosus]CAF3866205.1 unnamed protein product [Didymodactylos carnosus]